jgi:TolB-like protein
MAVLLLVLVMPRPGLAQVTDVYRDGMMDFGTIRTVAVMPFANLTRDQIVAERVRDVFINKLLSTEVDDTVKLGKFLKVDALITGVVREYGEVRAGTNTANVVSMSIQLIETETGKIVWSGSSTKGGITFWRRLLGSGGQPLNTETERAVDALFDKLLSPAPSGR